MLAQAIIIILTGAIGFFLGAMVFYRPQLKALHNWRIYKNGKSVITLVGESLEDATTFAAQCGEIVEVHQLNADWAIIRVE